MADTILCHACGAENEGGAQVLRGVRRCARARVPVVRRRPIRRPSSSAASAGRRLLRKRWRGPEARAPPQRRAATRLRAVRGPRRLHRALRGSRLEDDARAADPVLRTARTVIERYGGTVEKFIGDAVMAVWGAPIASEDDAERAVRAALELVDAVSRRSTPELGPGRSPHGRGRSHDRCRGPGHGRR